jgi:hypothetical protein
MYKVVHIWPGHIWTTLYKRRIRLSTYTTQSNTIQRANLSDHCQTASFASNDNNLRLFATRVQTSTICQILEQWSNLWSGPIYAVFPYLLVCVCMWVPGRVDVCMRIRACRLAISACNAFAPYLTSFVVPQSPSRFWHYLLNGAIFGEKVIEHTTFV